MNHKNDWKNSQVVFFQKYLQKYNHLQPPDTADFSMLGVIINQVTYFSMEITYTYLEV